MSERDWRQPAGHPVDVGATLERSPGTFGMFEDRYGPQAMRMLQRRRAQRKALRTAEKSEDVPAAAEHGISGAGGPLPHLDAIQRSFGRHDVGHVQAHSDAAAQEGAAAMGAEAFATGDHVASPPHPACTRRRTRRRT